MGLLSGHALILAGDFTTVFHNLLFTSFFTDPNVKLILKWEENVFFRTAKVPVTVIQSTYRCLEYRKTMTDTCQVGQCDSDDENSYHV